mgnify:CR=1 FL=1
MQETATKLLESKFPVLLEKFKDSILDATDFRGNFTLVIEPSKIRDMVRFLKEDSLFRMDMLMDLFGMDYDLFEPPMPERFCVVYQLVSLFQKQRIFLKVYLKEDAPKVDSIHDLYAAANWFEREAWDLFGIVFEGHPHLKRILCHNEFVGHPLRKDYQSDKYQPLRTAITAKEF